MSSSSHTLRKQLEDLARDTSERLDEARSLYVRFGEETITDLLLLEIKRRKRPGSALVQTSPYKEKTSGTDWEWWIGSSRVGWVRYAVQAKRADKDNGRYNSLSHKIKMSGTLQIELLKRYAAGTGAVPLYCFYNYPYPWVSSVHWQCCSPTYEPEQLACTVAPIAEVEKAMHTHGGRNFDRIHRRPWVVPWRCLAYCPRIRRAQRNALQSPNRYAIHPLATDGARVFPSLPDEIASALDQASKLGPLVMDPNESGSDEPYPRRVLVLETSPQDEDVADDA